MFGPLMIHLIFWQIDSTLAITKHRSRVLNQTQTKSLNQIYFFPASFNAMYYASVEGNATAGCNEIFRLTAQPEYMISLSNTKFIYFSGCQWTFSGLSI